MQSDAGPGANNSDLVSPAIFVGQYPSSVAAILKPFAVVPPPVRPNHETTPRHHIIHPFALVPAHPPHLESSSAAGRRKIKLRTQMGVRPLAAVAPSFDVVAILHLVIRWVSRRGRRCSHAVRPARRRASRRCTSNSSLCAALPCSKDRPGLSKAAPRHDARGTAGLV